MQVPRLGDPVGGVGERQPGGGRGDAAQAELPAQQVGAEEAQRPREQEQQVVTDERRDGSRSDPRDRAVAEQRVGERQAQRVGVEDVGVEHVQRVVEQAVPDPRDLPRGPDRVAEVGSDAAREMQDQRPGRQHREGDAGERDEDQLARGELAERGPSRASRAAPRRGMRRQRAVALIGRRSRGSGARRGATGGAGHAGAERGLVFSRADRRSIRNTPATVKHVAGEPDR